MAFGNRHSAGTIWLPTGNPDTTNISPTDMASLGGDLGSLGLKFEANNALRTYQRVQLDSGATAATPAGAVAANQAAYWKDKTAYIVTNDSRFAMAGAAPAGAFRNYGAGVFRMANTAGYYCDILKRGQNIPLKDGGNTFAAGEIVILENDTSAAAFDRLDIGTAASSQQIGVARGAAAGGNVNVDVAITDDDQ